LHVAKERAAQDLGAILEAIKKAQAGAAGANDDDSDEESDAD
jgi:hypothetical protein